MSLIFYSNKQYKVFIDIIFISEIQKTIFNNAYLMELSFDFFKNL